MQQCFCNARGTGDVTQALLAVTTTTTTRVAEYAGGFLNWLLVLPGSIPFEVLLLCRSPVTHFAPTTIVCRFAAP